MLIKFLIYNGNFPTWVNRRNYCLIRDLNISVYVREQFLKLVSLMKNVVNSTSFSTSVSLHFYFSIACSWNFLITCNKFSGLHFALVCWLYKAPCAVLWYIFELCAWVSTRGLLPFFSRYVCASGFQFDDLFPTCVVFASYLCLIFYGYLGQCSYDTNIVYSYCSRVPFLNKPALNGFCCISRRCCCNFVGVTCFVYLLVG
jgi:hypothetical protein